MAKYGMAIKLDTCIGCGACALACKTENNTQYEDLVNGRKYNWADFISKTEGKYPYTSFTVRPVLCNHCTDAPCVANCLAAEDPLFNNRRAMYKTDTGITMHSDDRCIGCQNCIVYCPYSDKNTITAGTQYSVLSYNPNSPAPHSVWAGTDAILTGGTSTPAEVTAAATYSPPYKHVYTTAADKYEAVRPANVTEKCIFCEHRVLVGDEPYCVDSCPAGARVFGDLDDPTSEIAILVAAGNYEQLADNTGKILTTETNKPNVYYIGKFWTDVPEVKLAEKPVGKLHVYPNPASDNVMVDFELQYASEASVAMYTMLGSEVYRFDAGYRFQGANHVEINVSELAKGTYVCVMKTEKETQSANILISR